MPAGLTGVDSRCPAQPTCAGPIAVHDDTTGEASERCSDPAGGVVGAGQMGSGIAELSVRSGVGVTVFETTDALITADATAS